MIVFDVDKTDKELLIIEDVLKGEASFRFELDTADIQVIDTGIQLLKYYDYQVNFYLKKLDKVNLHTSSVETLLTSNVVC